MLRRLRLRTPRYARSKPRRCPHRVAGCFTPSAFARAFVCMSWATASAAAARAGAASLQLSLHAPSRPCG
eukprot:421038-Pleurochrysis_carterae.AAC.1